MRPVISQEEAEALIDQIPTIQAEAISAPTIHALAQHYRQLLRSGNSRDLLQLTMSIHCKQQAAESRNRRLGTVDAQYKKQAEQLLHGELSAALGIPYEDVQPYIARRMADKSAAQGENISVQ